MILVFLPHSKWNDEKKKWYLKALKLPPILLLTGSSCVFVWCNVILPDSTVSHCADAEASVRGSGSGTRRTQLRQVSTRWLDGMTFRSDLDTQKCWSVRSASHVRPRAKMLKKCAWESVSVHTTRSGCHAPIVNPKKKKKTTLSDLCRSNRSPWACVLPCV